MVCDPIEKPRSLLNKLGSFNSAHQLLKSSSVSQWCLSKEHFFVNVMPICGIFILDFDKKNAPPTGTFLKNAADSKKRRDPGGIQGIIAPHKSHPANGNYPEQNKDKRNDFF